MMFAAIVLWGLGLALLYMNDHYVFARHVDRNTNAIKRIEEAVRELKETVRELKEEKT